MRDTSMTNGERNVSNRFVTKMERIISSPLSLSPLSFRFSFSLSPSLAATNFLSFLSNGRWFAVRCCDDATGTYMVIMWHGCRSRVVVSHREALPYRRRGPPSRGPPVKPVRRGPRVWHAAHPRIRSTALDSAAFLRDSIPPLSLPLRLPLITASRCLYRSWHQKARCNSDLSGHSVTPAKEYMEFVMYSLINKWEDIKRRCNFL